MTKDEQLLADIRAQIDMLPEDQFVACNALAAYLRRLVEIKGEPVGMLAISLIMAEWNAE